MVNPDLLIILGAVLCVCLSGAGYALWVLHKRDAQQRPTAKKVPFA